MEKRLKVGLDSLKAKVAAGIAGTSLAAGSAIAEGVDVSAVVATIGTVVTAAGAIGVAILSMTAGVKLYKWVKGAM